jgi:hypothetical protein
MISEEWVKIKSAFSDLSDSDAAERQAKLETIDPKRRSAFWTSQ